MGPQQDLKTTPHRANCCLKWVPDDEPTKIYSGGKKACYYLMWLGGVVASGPLS